jgi:hypothetical protein
MFASWKSIATVGGSGALTYLAASPTQNSGGQPTLRLTMGSSDALLMDVRALGGLAMGFASMYKGLKAGTREWLGTGAVASFSSLASTEAIRYQANKGGANVYPGGTWPKISGMGSAPAYQQAPSSAWARR